ncbi:MAG: phosphate starvation-inducible protein PhoH [Bacteroidota bacterium]|nr:phosphate starvation-inducible protein PhoH [Bacteroidota bacterium]
MDIHEKKINLEDADLLSLFGSNDSYLQLIENRFQTSVSARGNVIILKGEPQEIKIIEQIIKEMIYILKRNGSLNPQDVETVMDLMTANDRTSSVSSNSEQNNVIYYGAKSPIRWRNQKQFDYYKKVLENDLVFSIGPAGTGKTFLAVAMALSALKHNEVTRIILSRPAVEAGESLGFLPGDLLEKIDPYLRPLTDALHYMLSPDKLKSMMEKEVIEIIPLAYMRGRTLNSSFVILDEAQNATQTQLKMFLTRLGMNSKAIVTGDVTQIDLQDKGNSGLVSIQQILRNIEGIEFIYFSNKDVVRHRLVAEIIRAYEKDLQRKQPNGSRIDTEIPTDDVNIDSTE